MEDKIVELIDVLQTQAPEIYAQTITYGIVSCILGIITIIGVLCGSIIIAKKVSTHKFPCGSLFNDDFKINIYFMLGILSVITIMWLPFIVDMLIKIICSPRLYFMQNITSGLV